VQTADARFGFEAYEQGNIVVASGEIDLATAPQLGESIAQFSTGDVIVDLTAVEFMDSSGLKVLVVAHRRLARRGSRLVIRGASPMTMAMMKITGLDAVFDFDTAT
jgi:anti-sigma B factor antagonist